MGVKDLWNILSPLCERKPLFELQGKTVAIDLSCWVVDSQTITDNSSQPKMYLRNLYFRTAFLLLQGISPVFVLEGKAPTLKHNTIAKRNDIRHGFRERNTTRKGGRSQFNRVLKECKEMLMHMGLACIQGDGEAEAMCAYLNQDGLVDGCISQDSDCFLYGAKIVYRNFCTSAQGNRGGSAGAVDEYSIEKIERLLDLGRNKMIALALLCGCDYNDGLSGVGKEAALKLFKNMNDKDVLKRLKSWRTNDDLDRREAELQNPNLCTSCGHTGKIQKHTKSGCVDCGTIVKCNDSYKEKRALILNEISLRKKALLVENFPDQALLDEFLIRKDSVPTKMDIQWKQPNISELIAFMEKHLTWVPQYTFEKLFPLVTRWQLLHLPNISLDDRLSIPDLFLPGTIKKIRNIRSVASYEIIWQNDHSIVERLRECMALYEEQDDDNVDSLAELTTIEPQAMVSNCYPELVETFESVRNLKAKKRPTKKKGNDANDGNTEKNRKGKGRKKGTKNVDNNRKIDEFVSKNPVSELERSLDRLSITPKRCKGGERQQAMRDSDNRVKRGPQFDKVLRLENVNPKLNCTLDKMFNELSPDDFVSDNEDNDLNMTEIIDNICSQRKMFQFSGTSTSELNFGMDNTGDYNKIHREVNTESKSNECNESTKTCDLSVDEFANINESYVPLNQRLLTVADKLGKPNESIHTSHRFSLGFDDLMNDTDPENK
ncbi:XPG-like endonuclease [Megalopta genalis]|uniref:XPG-like endonuclease n=1 Tax=Megalopta genalis TaxID=115081 RepID=UPI003FD16C5D